MRADARGAVHRARAHCARALHGRAPVAALGLAALIGAPTASAHPAALALLELQRRSPTEVRGAWHVEAPSGAALPGVIDGTRLARLRPGADGCTIAEAEADAFLLRCPGTVDGARLTLPSAALTGLPVLVRYRASPVGATTPGASASGPPGRLLVPDHGVVILPGAAAAPGGAAAVRLGFAHAAGGADHALVMACLPLVAAGWRRLLGWVTAFTLGHALALGLVAVGGVRLPAAPVEVGIALSVLWVALLATRAVAADDAAAAPPWRDGSLAVAFGLLHGCGFAGGLVALGATRSELVGLLVPFHVGVELAQAAWVAVALLVLALARRWGVGRVVGRAVGTAAGAAAVFWLLQRTLALGV